MSNSNSDASEGWVRRAAPPGAWQRLQLALAWLRSRAQRLGSRAFAVVRALPVVEFYVYMGHTNPRLLANTLFVNYALPALLELMPWYLSLRKLSKELRESKNVIEHSVISGRGGLSLWQVGGFIAMTVVYASIQTLEQILRNRVDLENRLTLKRLIMERILYSEIGALQVA